MFQALDVFLSFQTAGGGGGTLTLGGKAGDTRNGNRHISEWKKLSKILFLVQSSPFLSSFASETFVSGRALKQTQDFKGRIKKNLQ